MTRTFCTIRKPVVWYLVEIRYPLLKDDHDDRERSSWDDPEQCLRGRRPAVCIDVNVGGRTTTEATAVMTAVDFAPLAPLFGSNSGLETPFLCTNELVSETLPLEDGSTHFLM